MKNKMLTNQQLLMIVFGTTLFACSINWFITPVALFSGGVVGLSQVLRTVFFSGVQIDMAGIINFCLNIPLFILAYKSLNNRIIVGTLLSLVLQAVLFAVLPIPSTPILNDILSNIVIGGIIGGFGCGLVLTNGATAGGLDILGVYLTQKQKNFSVGKLGILFNAVLFSVCAVLFNLSTALYSIIYVVIYSFALDRFHLQNIELTLMIFTHHPEIKNEIMHRFVRGVTCWKGMGAYTGASTEVLVTVVSKKEVEEIKKDILDLDPDAFIIVNESTNVTGGYQKRLI